MSEEELSRWLRRKPGRTGARVRLFCFPYAGVGASVYRPWSEEIGPAFELFGVQPPGREVRFAEPPFSRLTALLDALLPAIRPFLDRPFAFFGHSLGTLVSFELCRRLRAEGGPLPARLFVSGRRAAQVKRREERLHELPDSALIEELRRYNGTPPEVLANKELMELVLPVVRADFAVHETYVYVDEAKLDLPISAFGGLADSDVSEADIDAWRHQTTRAFRLRMFPGDHFFLNEERRAIAQAIAEDLDLGARP